MLFINMSFERHLVQNYTKMDSDLEEYFWAGTDIVLNDLKRITDSYSRSYYCFNWKNSCPNYNNPKMLLKLDTISEN